MADIQNLDFELRQSIDDDDINTTRSLLEQGADPNVMYDKNTPLINAVRKNNLSMVELLVDNGADINFRTSYYKSAIDIATENLNYNLVKWLWEHGAKVNSAYVPQMAMQKDYLMMEILILRGGEVNYQYYNNALGWTVRNDNIEETKWLLEHGAVFKTDYVIHEAIKNENYELVDLLLEQVNKNEIELIGPLAAKAASAKQWLLAKKLIEYGYDINAHNTDDIYSGNFQSPILTLAVYYSDIEFIRWLLQHGADVSHRDSMGRSAINYATISDKDDVVCLLLEYGAPLQYINYKPDQEKYRQLCQHQPVKSLQQLADRSINRHQVNTSIIPLAVASDPEEVRRLELLRANDNKSRPLSFAI